MYHKRKSTTMYIITYKVRYNCSYTYVIYILIHYTVNMCYKHIQNSDIDYSNTRYWTRRYPPSINKLEYPWLPHNPGLSTVKFEKLASHLCHHEHKIIQFELM